jgi:hypothetical protein
MPCDRARALADASRADLPMSASPRTTSAAPRSWTQPISSARTPVSRSHPTIGCTLDSPHHHPSLGTKRPNGAPARMMHQTLCKASYPTGRIRRNRRVAALAERPAGEGTPGTLCHTASAWVLGTSAGFPPASRPVRRHLNVWCELARARRNCDFPQRDPGCERRRSLPQGPKTSLVVKNNSHQTFECRERPTGPDITLC